MNVYAYLFIIMHKYEFRIVFTFCLCYTMKHRIFITIKEKRNTG